MNVLEKAKLKFFIRIDESIEDKELEYQKLDTSFTEARYNSSSKLVLYLSFIYIIFI